MLYINLFADRSGALLETSPQGDASMAVKIPEDPPACSKLSSPRPKSRPPSHSSSSRAPSRASAPLDWGSTAEECKPSRREEARCLTGSNLNCSRGTEG